jgi:hypothetical protein
VSEQPIAGSVAWWRFVAARFPEHEHCVAEARARDRAHARAQVQAIIYGFTQTADAIVQALAPVSALLDRIQERSGQ